MPARKKTRATGDRKPSSGSTTTTQGASTRELNFVQSVELGRNRAAQTLARQRKASQRQSMAIASLLERAELAKAWALAPTGLLMIQGDSWFDFGTNDIRDLLQYQYKYEIDGESKRGMRIVSLAEDTEKIEELCDKIGVQTAAGKIPKAILLSGGGNDIADKFTAFLNPRNSPQSGWNQTLVDQFVDETLKNAYAKIIAHLDTYCRTLLNHTVPILVHGYACPVPDGRDVWPWGKGWLKPGFVDLGYKAQQERTKLAGQFIDKFNLMLSELHIVVDSVDGVDRVDMSSVVYVDLRPALSSGSDWKNWWENELHPTSDLGFPAVAKIFADTLANI